MRSFWTFVVFVCVLSVPVGCGGNLADPPALSVTIVNDASTPMRFTLGASVMDADRTVVLSNAVPLSDTVLDPGESRSFNRLLEADAGADSVFVVGATGYDTTIPDSHANAELTRPVLGEQNCFLSYTFSDVGHFDVSCR